MLLVRTPLIFYLTLRPLTRFFFRFQICFSNCFMNVNAIFLCKDSPKPQPTKKCMFVAQTTKHLHSHEARFTPSNNPTWHAWKITSYSFFKVGDIFDTLIDTSSTKPMDPLGFSSQLNRFVVSPPGRRLWVWRYASWVSWPLCFRWTWRPSRCRPGWLVGWLVECSEVGKNVVFMGWFGEGIVCRWRVDGSFCVCVFFLGDEGCREFSYLFCLKFIQRGT